MILHDRVKKELYSKVNVILCKINDVLSVACRFSLRNKLYNYNLAQIVKFDHCDLLFPTELSCCNEQGVKIKLTLPLEVPTLQQHQVL